MSGFLPISVTLITKNEASRIGEAILSVKSFAKEIIVVDSGSTDGTAGIAEGLGARVFVQPFVGFGQQKNYAQSLCSEEWVLNIDADERVPHELAEEIRKRISDPKTDDISGFFIPRKTWYLDRWILHSGWYPNYLVRLVRRKSAEWTEPQIHEALKVRHGKVECLKNPLEHYSFPSQKSHILKNLDYADRAKTQLLGKGRTVHFWDVLLRPFWKFFDIYFLKLGFLDGSAGFFIGIHSAYALFLRYAFLHEQNVKNSRHRQQP